MDSTEAVPEVETRVSEAVAVGATSQDLSPRHVHGHRRDSRKVSKSIWHVTAQSSTPF